MNAVSIIAFALLALTTWRTAGFFMAAVALVIVARKFRSETTVASLIVVACSFLADYRRGVHETGALVVVGVLLGLLILNQPILELIMDKPTIQAANLVGYRPTPALLVAPARTFVANPALVAVLGIFAAARWVAWPLAIVVTLTAVGVAYIGVQAVRARVRGSGDESAKIRAALERHDARFLLHFSAPDFTEYHVEMWRPYLDRIDLPWVIVAREDQAFQTLAASAAGTRVPVVLCPLVSDLDTVVTPSVRCAFYVNNGMKNSHLVRISQLRHIQLLHGDSDKASSFNRVTAMFDRIFVAGQAGIDRYAANGVVIPESKFDIVGRPQVESIAVSRTPIRHISKPVVMYATTWVGVYEDARYGSLSIGETIVRALLRRGATVVLRPHPYTERDRESVRHLDRLTALLAADRTQTGRPHVFGAAATTQLSLFACVNRANALISDVSGVASDFLYSEKPFALTNMRSQSAEAFVESFPLAGAAYVIDEHASNIESVLDDLLGPDPLEEIRRKAKAYYLGDFGDTEYAERFVTTARSYCAGMS